MNQETTSEVRNGVATRVPAPAPVDRVGRFTAYALAFEQVLVDDDWSRLEQYFSPDAVRHVVGGGPLAEHSSGREAVIADLRACVEELDRRFDRRLPEILSGPSERDGVVWIDWRLTLQRDGLPDLRVEGTHGTHFDGERICRIEEAVNNEVTLRLEAYLDEYGSRLRPAAPRRRHAPRISRARMRDLMERYAAAKSRADVEGALALCHPRFFIDTVPFAIASRDRAETEMHLRVFFEAFPDYGATVGGTAYGRAGAACWGTAGMTLRGAALGLEPTHRRAEVPFVSWFTFEDGLLASERFYFDLAALCDGLGVPVVEMRAALAALRNDAGALVAGG